MLALRDKAQTVRHGTPNILPCRINHNGPTGVTKRYWSPNLETDGSRTSYFRGRKLRGRVVKVPENYKGILAKVTDEGVDISRSSARQGDPYDDGDSVDTDMDENDTDSVKLIDSISEFDHLVVWGHDQLPIIDDPFVKGVEEWIALAAAIHSTEHSNIRRDDNGNAKIDKSGTGG